MTSQLYQWTGTSIERFWDQYSSRPETYFSFQYGREIVRRLRPYFRGPRVLDYGSGPGFLIGHLLDAGLEVTGCDISPDSVAKVNQIYDGRKGFNGAFLPDELAGMVKFDNVICVEVVEHLLDDVLDLVVSDIRLRVRPGGVAIFTTPNQEDLSFNNVSCPNCDAHFHRWQHVRSWSAQTLSTYLTERSFSDVSAIQTDFSYREPEPLPERFYKRWIRSLFGLHSQPPRMGTPHLACIAEVAVI